MQEPIRKLARIPHRILQYDLPLLLLNLLCTTLLVGLLVVWKKAREYLVREAIIETLAVLKEISCSRKIQ
jgi:hypothetical protein